MISIFKKCYGATEEGDTASLGTQERVPGEGQNEMGLERQVGAEQEEKERKGALSSRWHKTAWHMWEMHEALNGCSVKKIKEGIF